MNNLNSVLIEGSLVRDAELRSAPEGASICAFTIASSRCYRDDSGTEKEVSFFNVEARAKLAETAGNLGRKGCGVRVVGRLKQELCQSAGGKTYSKTVIVAEHLEFRPDCKDGRHGGAETGETKNCGGEK